MFSEKQVGALRAFAADCHRHAVTTGDADMDHIDGVLCGLWAAFIAAREAEGGKDQFPAFPGVQADVDNLRAWVFGAIDHHNNAIIDLRKEVRVLKAEVENKQKELQNAVEYHDIVIRALQGSYMELLKKGAGL